MKKSLKKIKQLKVNDLKSIKGGEVGDPRKSGDGFTDPKKGGDGYTD